MGFTTKDTTAESDDNSGKVSKPKKQEGSLVLTVEEYFDDKNKSKRAHRSISPKYDGDGKLIAYSIGGYTPGYLKHLEEEKKKKLKSIQ